MARTRELKWGKRQLVFSEPANVGDDVPATGSPGTYRVKLEWR